MDKGKTPNKDGQKTGKPNPSGPTTVDGSKQPPPINKGSSGGAGGGGKK